MQHATETVPRSMRSFLAVPLLSSRGCVQQLLALQKPIRTAWPSSRPPPSPNAFEELARTYEEQHPDTDLQLTFAGSQILRFQIEQGASADLFASANDDAYAGARRRGPHGVDPEPSAITDLVVIVPRENPAGIERFDQLDRASSIVVGTTYVPIGAYTEQVLELASAELGEVFVNQVRDRVVSMESNVRLVRAKVELGQADAAFVYRTDARASERVRLVPIPEELNVQARFSIAITSETKRTHAAARFFDYLASHEARSILESHGFETES